MIERGERFAVIETAHLKVYVPAGSAEELRDDAARAERLYVALADAAGYRPRGKLPLLLGERADAHNGFHLSTPFDLVQSELVAAPPQSTIFLGEGHLERTLVHEFAHHVTIDRNPPFRRFLERIFGRVLPDDPLSALIFYLSTPSQQTMPSFWLEGLAMWAETAYGRQEVWRGRGADPLVHMYWRLDAAGDGIPEVGTWRRSYHRWPYGRRVYLYGVAYLRWLISEHDIDPWILATHQSRRWAFAFDGGARRLLGVGHAALIEAMRADLAEEQAGILARLRAVPTTPAERLSEPGTFPGIPVWNDRGEIVVPLGVRFGPPRFAAFAPEEGRRDLGQGSRGVIAHQADGDGDRAWASLGWRGHASGNLRTADGRTFSWGRRTVDLDIRRRGEDRWRVAALRNRSAGERELTVVDLAVEGPWWNRHLAEADRDIPDLPVEGLPWSPSWRPGHDDQLCWVESDAEGSRLVLGDAADPEARRVLVGWPHRLMFPRWSRDGRRLYFTSDRSGVPNAYALLFGAEGGTELRPVTHTVGGVVACVPSPDGEKLAIIDHDHRGPFLAVIEADPETWPEALPEIAIAWPEDGQGRRPLPAEALEDGGGEELVVRPYRGLREIRPRYWSPTTRPAPGGGWGVAGFASDPLLTHVIRAGVGVGFSHHAHPVGRFEYGYHGWPLSWSLGFWQAEWEEELALEDPFGHRFDDVRLERAAELTLGRGIVGGEGELNFNGAAVTAGVADHESVDGVPFHLYPFWIGPLVYLHERHLQVDQVAFDGQERYVEIAGAIDTRSLWPTSHHAENGVALHVTYRHSGFGGDLERNRVTADLSGTISVLPRWGHQAYARVVAGWSDGDRNRVNRFHVGSHYGGELPRGYDHVVDAGRHLFGYTLAWRAPVWRPFVYFGATPFVKRQLVVEPFFDAAKVSSDRPGGNGRWFRSAGAEVASEWQLSYVRLQPVVGVARQLDAGERWRAWITLRFGW